MDMTNKKRKRFHFSAFSIILLVVLILYTLSLIGLLAWGFFSSFKEINYFIEKPYTFFPEKWANNLGTILALFSVKPQTTGIPVYVEGLILNSLIYAIGCGVVSTIVPCATAYVCARYNFKFSKIMYGIVIVTMIIPLVGTLPSELELATNLGLYDKVYGLWIMKAHFLGMYFLVFFNVYKAMPASYSEAAKVDGASNFSIMMRIAFPLTKNTILTVFLINFIGFWNDYQTPLLYMPSFPTMAYGLFNLVRGTAPAEVQGIPFRLAGTVIVTVPILVLFLIFQKRLLGNLTMGGVKG